MSIIYAHINNNGNVYIEPGSYEIYKKTGEFPEGTIFFKELQRAKKDDAWTQFYRLLDN